MNVVKSKLQAQFRRATSSNQDRAWLEVLKEIKKKHGRNGSNGSNGNNNSPNRRRRNGYDDDFAGLDGLNKGIWNVSVLPALRELTAAIAEKRELQRGATFVDGLRNQMVLDAVTASTASRKWEDLDMSEAC